MRTTHDAPAPCRSPGIAGHQAGRRRAGHRPAPEGLVLRRRWLSGFSICQVCVQCTTMNSLVIAGKTPSDAGSFPSRQKKNKTNFSPHRTYQKNKKFFLSYRPCLSSVTGFFCFPLPPQFFPFFSLFIFPRRRKAFQDNPSLPLHFPPQTPGGFPGQP